MHLVGMQHDRHARRADAFGTAIAERLKPPLGDADRIGLVPMRIVGMAEKPRAQPLDAGAGMIGRDEVAQG
jgi:hypothetical protein